ncbi:3-hydroxyacyl-[acyl-carrier-protein] dehydratase FabZ [Poriferisphaera corsica]|uniref:3-hydroxyacyl-[acyl-carrier-protein] dehydratase FabZ n=1 Tax=Poriferisphaera corsica TaxID=2528020 RepID=A0A517YQK5_9BACT|nr:polyketide synthase dehydratase domain-containing protein [Poriferisphaera corsica]QDU32507.1 3-hydroxyacyl-[acyl-carrier-protein] dehydratase FabZ [Poriferisphaera corsica]
MRFELIDRVIELEENNIRALKTVTSAEEYLGDHFPGFPVLPGVMMLETLVQAGRKLTDALPQSPTMPLVVKEVRNLKYGNMVKPGQTLEVEVTLKKAEQDKYDFTGVGTVDGQVAVKGRFTLIPLDQAE